MVAGTVAKLTLAKEAPVFYPGSTVNTCEGITCKPLECKPPFKFVNPEAAGTCCALCWADDVKVPEDRSWAEGMTGGVGMNNKADPVLCRGVVCPPADCPEFDRIFDDRCCTKCSSSAAKVTPADLAKDYEELP